MPFPWVLWLCRFAQTSAAVLLVGTAALRLLARGTGLDPAAFGWRVLTWASGTVLLLAGGLQLGLTVAEMSGKPLAQALPDGAMRTVLDGTHFGTVWTTRMGLLTGWLLLTSFVAWRHRLDRLVPVTLEAAGSLLAVALLGSLVFGGHAQASDKNAWLLPVTVAHAIAAGAWPGGLLPLTLLLWRARHDPALGRAAVAVTRRFSRLSVGAVGVLAFSSVLNGMGLVGTMTAFWTSTYGRLVLCKAVLFALMVGLGAVNRRLIQRREAVDPARTVRRLWRNVAVECVLAAGVLLATEALGSSAPPIPA